MTDEKNTNKEMQEITMEKVPVGIVTMLSEQQAKTNNRLVYAIITIAVCWLLTVGGFLYYLSEYEVQTTNYGPVNHSKIENQDQKANSIVNNAYLKGDK